MDSIDKALKTMIDNMPEKTGKSLEAWKKVLASKAFSKHSEAVKFLKTEHQVTHGYASAIVSLSKDNDTSSVDLIDQQYTGKEKLKPLYIALVEIVKGFGEDVKITPNKTSVSIIRKRQFALIKPATKTRIDLGLKITGKEIGTRLENSGPFGTMCTHRVKISSIDHIDDELILWLKEAYEKSV